MPRRGLAGIWELVLDLWRELSPVLRACLFGGVVLGLGLGLYYVLRLPPDYGLLGRDNRIHYRTVLWPRLAMVFGLTFLGGLAGTAVGSVLDQFFGTGNKPDAKGKSRRKTGRDS